MSVRDTDFYNNATTGIPDWLNKSFAGYLVKLFPNGSMPLFGMTGMVKDEGCTAVEHGYFSKTLVFPSVTIDNVAGYLAGATTLTVVSTATVIAGDLLRVQSTGEIMRVASVASATSIVVVRGVGQVAANAIADGAKAYCTGNSFEQASSKPTSRLMSPARVINNTQIHRNGWTISRTLAAISTIVGNDNMSDSKMDAAHFHGSSIENTILFGQKSGLFLNQQYITTSDGIIERVRRDAPASNTTVAGATTTYSQLQAMLNPVFDTMSSGQNGNSRVLCVGGRALEVINEIGRLSGQYQIIDGQTSFGLQFSSFKTARGTFKMIEHPMLNSNADWARMAIAVDMNTLKVRSLRKTFHEAYGTNGQIATNVEDAVGGVYTTENTIECINPSANAVIYGLTAGAA
jgi:hypothetical protein